MPVNTSQEADRLGVKTLSLGEARNAGDEAGSENLHFAWNRRHDCLHEEPSPKGVAIPKAAGKTRKFSDRRAGRKRTLRDPLGD